MITRITQGMHSELRKLAKSKRTTVHKLCVKEITEALAKDAPVSRFVPRDRRLCLGLPKTTEQQIRLIAKQGGSTLSTVVRDYLRQMLERNKR